MKTLIEKLEQEIAKGEAVLASLESTPALFTLHTGTMTGLNMALDIVKKHSDWISVHERLPDDGQIVLIYSNYYQSIKLAQRNKYNNQYLWASVDGFDYDVEEAVNYWQPLPQSPSEVQSD